jgi:hypothetical protein
MPYITYPHRNLNNDQVYTTLNLDQTDDSLVQAARRAGQRVIVGRDGTLNFSFHNGIYRADQQHQNDRDRIREL